MGLRYEDVFLVFDREKSLRGVKEFSSLAVRCYFPFSGINACCWYSARGFVSGGVYIQHSLFKSSHMGSSSYLALPGHWSINDA